MWIRRDIAAPIPAGIGSLASEVGSVLSTVNPLLTAATAAVNAASLFFNPTTNPYSALATGLLTEAQVLNNDIFSTGIYELFVSGDNVSGITAHDQFGIPLLTPRQAINAAIGSFNDLGDANRPQFSINAEVCALGLLATAPSSAQFLTLVNGLLNIFNIPDLSNFAVTIKRRSTPAVLQAVPPLWKNFNLASIGNLNTAQSAVNSAITTALGYSLDASAAIQNLKNVISGKQAQLTTLETNLNNLATNLQSFTGLYTLNVPPAVGGNALIQAALLDCPLELSTNQYTIIVLFVGGSVGGTLETVNAFRQMVL
jgi:hypothetical protein